ncbi:class I SAM-dependent methyltransferase [Mucilaginibacter ximonensis]|uniref:S-adenosyl-L-methionine-dependent methyltransferase n=1 Tax=Mucilaginibacter ximonensis TaxID=538021 RepID=A0ABW5YG51_9SPHI
MNKDAASSTAVGAAMLRAAHQVIDGEYKLLDDPIILKLIGEDAVAHICERRNDFYFPGILAMRTHIVLRSRYAEDCLKDAYDAGVDQFLILGAGMDTFAYRQPEWANGLMIVEADHPASQVNKLEHLTDAGIAIPENVSFVKVDLEQDALAEIFKNSKLNLNKPVFVACLGVLVYLTKDAIAKIFKFVGGLPKGTEFVFTASQKRTGPWSAKVAERVAKAGEPWISHFDFDEMEKQLKKSGFSQVIFVSPAESKKRYFTGAKLRIPPPQRCSLVRVIV